MEIFVREVMYLGKPQKSIFLVTSLALFCNQELKTVVVFSTFRKSKKVRRFLLVVVSYSPEHSNSGQGQPFGQPISHGLYWVFEIDKNHEEYQNKTPF